MTAAAQHGYPAEVEKTPAGIRAALLPEQRDHFNGDLDAAMADAIAQQSVKPMLVVLDQWYAVARMTVADPSAWRSALRRIDTLLSDGTTGPVRVLRTGRSA